MNTTPQTKQPEFHNPQQFAELTAYVLAVCNASTMPSHIERRCRGLMKAAKIWRDDMAEFVKRQDEIAAKHKEGGVK